jgi:hypothetical protein
MDSDLLMEDDQTVWLQLFKDSNPEFFKKFFNEPSGRPLMSHSFMLLDFSTNLNEEEMSKDVKLFQYVIFYVPTEEETKTGKKPEVLVDIKNVLASEERNVVVMASRDIPSDYLNRLENVNIVVRPF